MDVILIYVGIAVVAYWVWGKSRGPESPLIVDGGTGVAVLAVGIALAVIGIMIGTR